MRVMGGILLAFALAVSLDLAVAVPEACSKVDTAGSTLADAFDAVYWCSGVPKWQLVPAMWSPIHVNVSCTTSSYHIYTARSLDELAEKQNAVLWCGIRFLSHPKSCAFTVSPFHDTYMGIKVSQSTGTGVYKPRDVCTVATSKHLDPLLLGLTASGSALFLNAPWLAMSTSFRLSAGSLMFASGAILVLMFVVMRSVPHRNKLFAALAVSASSTLALVRWLFGTWAPSLVVVAQSRPFQIYLAASALLGLGVTYWLDDPGNAKLTTTIRVMLQLAGLAMVYMGTASDEASLALVALLLSSRMLAAVARHMYTFLCRRLQQRRRKAQQRQQQPPVPKSTAWQARHKHAAPRQAQANAGTHGAGLLSDEEGWDGGHEPMERPPRHAEGVDSSRGAEARQRAAAAAAAATRAWTWGSPLVPAPAAAPTPLHLRTPPPNPWEQHGQQGWQREEQQPPEEGEEEEEEETPWSLERVAVDITRPRQLQPLQHEASPPQQRRQQQQQRQQRHEQQQGTPATDGELSPLVQAGKIYNLDSGRIIMIDKPKYNELVAKGYTPDFKAGVLSPPRGRERGSGATPTAAQQRGAAAGSGSASGSSGGRRGRATRSGAGR